MIYWSFWTASLLTRTGREVFDEGREFGHVDELPGPSGFLNAGENHLEDAREDDAKDLLVEDDTGGLCAVAHFH